MRIRAAVVPLFLITPIARAGHLGHPRQLDLTNHWVGYACLVVFVAAMLVVIAEEFTLLRKSKPVLLAAGILWGLLGWFYGEQGLPQIAEAAYRQDLLAYGEVLLFMLVVIAYVNALRMRNLFGWMECKLGERGFSYRRVYWSLGFLCFTVSPWADNLATAMFFSTLLVRIARASPRVVTLGCIHIVIAANAGGVFSAFGDITTLLVWRENLVTPQGALDLLALGRLFLPALIAYLLPAWLISRALPHGRIRTQPDPTDCKQGTWIILGLFLLTLAMAVAARTWLQLPAVLGMMTGMGLLMLYGFMLRMRESRASASAPPFDIYRAIAGAEWNSLLFLYGVIACTGALAFAGYLPRFGNLIYHSPQGDTLANLGLAGLSAVLDNIPVQTAVLAMRPEMSLGQWLLAVFSTGVGGSLLSIGSAAGVAVMGVAAGHYTFFAHLRWLPAILLGYLAGVGVHFLLNAPLF